MLATYISTGDQDDDRVCRVFGLEFPIGEAVDVSDLPTAQQTLLKGNRTFTVEDGPAKPKAAVPAVVVPAQAGT